MSNHWFGHIKHEIMMQMKRKLAYVALARWYYCIIQGDPVMCSVFIENLDITPTDYNDNFQKI